MQIDFWPEEIKIRDIDRIDVSTIDDWNRYKETDHVARCWSFSDITEGKYFIYKTGARNPHLPDEVGPIFPYLLNAHTNNVITPTVGGTRSYPAWNLDVNSLSPNQGIGGKKHRAKRVIMQCHVLTALAFVKPNYSNQKIVAHQNEGEVENHHLWYNHGNLKWSTQRDNVASRFRFSTGGLVS
tara:strand:+ start:150 stop:698 length:549 start_codon:yes stop_codon:yes gene_type:complete